MFSLRTFQRVSDHARHRPTRLRLGQSLAISLLLLGGLWGVLLSLTSSAAQAQAPSNAQVFVQFDDHAHLGRPVTFTTPISGFAALLQTGLQVVYTDTSFGPAVCAIEGVGCPADDCFCAGNRYWGYSYWDGGAWQGYAVAAGGSLITGTGAIEGWRWGEFGDPQIEVTRTQAALDGLDWLAARQTITNGGTGSAGASVETLLALGANRQAGRDWRAAPSAPSLVGYMAAYGPAFSRTTVAAAGKLAVALSGADTCLPALTVTPQRVYSPTLGAYSGDMGQNSWAILGALALDEPLSADALAALRAAVQPEGGWEWSPGWGADTNATGLALQALIAAGESPTGTLVVNALSWLETAQQEDGGFPYSPGPGATSDANSTAYVIQALIAAGQDPNGAAWTRNDKTPIGYLLARQLPDGSFEWQPGSGANLLATQQAIPALLGWAYPLARQTLAGCPALHLPLIQRPLPSTQPAAR
jgi:hypothetical protein